MYEVRKLTGPFSWQLVGCFDEMDTALILRGEMKELNPGEQYLVFLVTEVAAE